MNSLILSDDFKTSLLNSGDGRQELKRLLKRSESDDSIVDEIVIALATSIIEGKLVPGDDVNSVELARMFDSSRTPVREALLILQREGFVDISARRRPRVAGYSLKEVGELYNLRAELYSIVSRSLILRATEADLTRLEVLQDTLDQAAEQDDVDAFFWANVQFRNTEAEIANDATLRRVLDSLGVRALQLRRLSLSQPSRLGRSASDHRRLLQAYRDRDETLASALTRSLVLRGYDAIKNSGWTGEALK